MVQLFSNAVHKNVDVIVSVMLSACTQMLMHQDDGMPNEICDSCLDRLISAYEFQQECIRSDQRIRAVLGLDAAGDSSSMHISKEEMQPHDIFFTTENTDTAVFIKSETIEVVFNDANNDDDGLHDNYDEDDAASADNLKDELPRKAPKKRTQFPCKSCDKIFANAYRLQRHSNNVHIKTKKKPYQCEMCQTFYVLKSKLIAHMEAKHSQSAGEAQPPPPSSTITEYKCDYCTKSFFRRKTLVRHAKTHEQFKRHQCTHCDRAFSLTVQLTEHIALKHMNVKPHICHICQKGTALLFLG